VKQESISDHQAYSLNSNCLKHRKYPNFHSSEELLALCLIKRCLLYIDIYDSEIGEDN